MRDLREHLRADVTAGLTVAVLLVPQAMAYAALAGMPPQAGLHAAIVSLLAYAALGSSRVLLVGPAALDALLVAAVVTPVADGDAERYVDAASLLAVLVGLVQLALGLLRLSALSTVLTASAVRGFTAGAALLVCATQVPELLGLPVGSPGSLLLPTVDQIARSFTGAQLQTALLGLGALLLLVLLPRAFPRLPTPLIIMLLTTGLVVLLGLEQQGVRVVGDVPAGPPVPALPRWDAALLRQLAPGALLIAFVSWLESSAAARRYAEATDRLNPRRELFALGAANTAAGLVRGFPGASGLARTAVNHRAGARTQLSGVLAAMVLLFVIVFLTPAFSPLPRATLAAVVFVAAASMVDLPRTGRLLRDRPREGAVVLVTLLATALLGVAPGLAVALVGSLLHRPDLSPSARGGARS